MEDLDTCLQKREKTLMCCVLSISVEITSTMRLVKEGIVLYLEPYYVIDIFKSVKTKNYIQFREEEIADSIGVRPNVRDSTAKLPQAVKQKPFMPLLVTSATSWLLLSVTPRNRDEDFVCDRSDGRI
ncbi:unnamed protein product [Lepeophtheirus salmonis]|uniref:(salmon louse) hypothetical protein n=1 Tax=Lepeophtheirus salmonis TaxID=72036 RepID=A0A7R8CTS8_LEPSM|nr:unnamed protein product [Lepeophtheirus salmonis]CAF2929192.1 unnamed protein product [Lepeophtheirus salmonis]